MITYLSAQQVMIPLGRNIFWEQFLADKTEETKITIYMFLWEALHKSKTLDMFENHYIQGLIHSTKIQEANRVSLISEVLRDFYYAHGIEATVRIDASSISIHKKIAAYKQNLFIDFFCKGLDCCPEKLKKTEDRKDLFFLEQNDLEEIALQSFGNELKEGDRYEVIKQGIRQLFDLEDRDAIFFCRNKMYIKFFNKAITNDGNDRRFNGQDEAELCQIYTSSDQSNYEKLIRKITSQLLAKELDLTKIDAIHFQQNYIPLLQQSIRNHFKAKFQDEAKLIGFVNYVLRKHFSQALQVIAKEALGLVVDRNANMKEFIDFYDGHEILIGKKKVKKTELTINGERWGYMPIFSLLQQFETVHKKIDDKKKELEAMATELSAKQKQIESFEAEQKTLENIFQEADHESTEVHIDLKEKRENYQELQLKQKSASGQTKTKLYSEVESSREEIEVIAKRDNELLNIRNQTAQGLEKLMIRCDEVKKEAAAYRSNIDLEKQKLQTLLESIKPLQQKKIEILNTLTNAIAKMRI